MAEVKHTPAVALPAQAEAAFVRLSGDRAPQPAYQDVNDVPMPLRQTLIELARQGMQSAEIAARFELPLDVVLLFTLGQPGDTEH